MPETLRLRIKQREHFCQWLSERLIEAKICNVFCCEEVEVVLCIRSTLRMFRWWRRLMLLMCLVFYRISLPPGARDMAWLLRTCQYCESSGYALRVHLFAHLFSNIGAQTRGLSIHNTLKQSLILKQKRANARAIIWILNTICTDM